MAADVKKGHESAEHDVRDADSWPFFTSAAIMHSPQ